MLEEARQDDVAALLNSVRFCVGFDHELEEYRGPISRLVSAGLIEVEMSRDPGSLRPIPFTKEESLAGASKRSAGLLWSRADHLWNFPSNSPRFEILITENGLTIAREILRDAGWPVKKPWSVKA